MKCVRADPPRAGVVFTIACRANLSNRYVINGNLDESALAAGVAEAEQIILSAFEVFSRVGLTIRCLLGIRMPPAMLWARTCNPCCGAPTPSAQALISDAERLAIYYTNIRLSTLGWMYEKARFDKQATVRFLKGRTPLAALETWRVASSTTTANNLRLGL